MIEPNEIRIARRELFLIHEVVLVRADPQQLVADAGLDLVEGGEDARQENVEPRGDMEAWNINGAAEIVLRPERRDDDALNHMDRIASIPIRRATNQ